MRSTCWKYNNCNKKHPCADAPVGPLRGAFLLQLIHFRHSCADAPVGPLRGAFLLQFFHFLEFLACQEAEGFFVFVDGSVDHFLREQVIAVWIGFEPVAYVLFVI